MTAAQIGKAAPPFELLTATGESVKLADYIGQRVVLYFYPKDMTPACTTEACDFRDQHEAFQELDTVILGISTDPVKTHARFIDKYGLPFHLLADEDHAVAEQYGVWVLKKLYGRAYMGLERSTFLIDRDGKLLKEWRKVKVKGHVTEALTYVRELEQ